MTDFEIDSTYEKKSNVGFLALVMLVMFAVACWGLSRLDERIKSIQKIVGTETPASMTWTNGHTYTTLVKHSANCPCVK